MDWFFVSTDGARARRPADVVIGIFGALVVFVTAVKSDQFAWLEELFSQFVGLFPSWIGTAFGVVYGIGLIYALVIVLMAVFGWSTRRALVRDLAVAIGLAALSTVVLTRLVNATWPVLLPELVDQVAPSFPVARVGMVTAVLVVAGPELVRPFRRVGWLLVGLMFFIAMALGYGLPGDALGGLGVGLVSASVVLVGFGSARGRASVDDVMSGLSGLGIEARNLTVAVYQRWGVRTFDCVGIDGAPMRVHVYGRDAKDAETLVLTSHRVDSTRWSTRPC